MINTGFIILAGQDLKAVYVLFKDDDTMKLPYFIAISGFVCALFAIGIPHLPALRIWLGFLTLFSMVYIVVAFVLLCIDAWRHEMRQPKVNKASKEMEALRFVNVEEQKKKWCEVYFGLGPAVSREYDGLLNSVNQKHFLVDFDPRHLSGKKEEAPPLFHGTVAIKGRWNQWKIHVH